MSDFSKMSPNDLVLKANQGLGGQGAVVEATLRLRDTVVAADGSAQRLSRQILWLTRLIAIGTVILVVFTIVLVVMTLRHPGT